MAAKTRVSWAIMARGMKRKCIDKSVGSNQCI